MKDLPDNARGDDVLRVLTERVTEAERQLTVARSELAAEQRRQRMSRRINSSKFHEKTTQPTRRTR